MSKLETRTHWVFKPDGSIQCSSHEGASLDDTRVFLESLIGAEHVLRMEVRETLVPRVCGHPTGVVHAFEITSTGLHLLLSGFVGMRGFRRCERPEKDIGHDRNIDALPGELREQTKSFIAQSLKAVVTQVLVKKPGGQGRVAKHEILVSNKAISNLILTDQTHQIQSQLQMGADSGMQTMDMALLDGIQNSEIDPDDAYRYAVDKRKFHRFVSNTEMLPQLDMANG